MPNKFRRQYLLTIEGSPHPQPIGCGDINHERNHLNANAAKLHLADEVERFYQTTLADRTVTIEIIDHVLKRADARPAKRFVHR